jgi:hypothetical protein
MPPSSLEVSHWQIQRTWINADCTHSGTWGAITRRTVAFDWRFSVSVPVDQDNMPDVLLEPIMLGMGGDDPSSWVNISIAFMLGDVEQNVEAVAMNMEQKFYYAPAALLQSAVPVLDASRDVIRMQCSGEGNSRLFLIPDEEDACQVYMEYLKGRGWL